MEQFSLPFEEKTSEESLSKSKILQWSKEARDEQYQKLIGQKPFSDMTPEQIAEGILDPEAEKEAVLRRNLDDDKRETTETYRR